MPGSSPVPRWMDFLMLSAGMLTAFASAMRERRRGFMPGSPPPFLAATVSSLMTRVKTLPRLASAAPFLCLIVCHLECPDMGNSLALTGEDDPDFSAWIPRAALIVAEECRHGKPGLFEAPDHLRHRECAEREREGAVCPLAASPFDEFLLEQRQALGAILPDRFNEREVGPAGAFATQTHFVAILAPRRQV